MSTDATDHDQLFKALIREFFADFLRLFFANWAARLDLSQPPEWLNTELHANAPDGAKHVLDLVAQVRAVEPPTSGDTDQTNWLVLVHIEIESAERTTSIKARLPSYYRYLRDQYRRPVLPIVIYLAVGLDGVGTDTVDDFVFDFNVNPFHYLYVGLPGLNAEDYVKGDNWLGVALAALMRIPDDRIIALGQEALERISEAPVTEQRRFLLGECVEAYLPVHQQVIDEYRDRMIRNSITRVPPVNKTSYMTGKEEGRRIALIEVLEAMLETKFGPLPPESLARLRELPDDRLKQVAVAMLTAATLAELGL